MFMKYNFVLYEIRSMVRELELDGQIFIPDHDAQVEFIDDCVANVIDKLDRYESYTPDYVAEILDLAKVYGYREVN